MKLSKRRDAVDQLGMLVLMRLPMEERKPKMRGIQCSRCELHFPGNWLGESEWEDVGDGESGPMMRGYNLCKPCVPLAQMEADVVNAHYEHYERLRYNSTAEYLRIQAIREEQEARWEAEEEAANAGSEDDGNPFESRVPSGGMDAVQRYRRQVAESGDVAEAAAIDGMPDTFVAALLRGDYDAADGIARYEARIARNGEL